MSDDEAVQERAPAPLPETVPVPPFEPTSRVLLLVTDLYAHVGGGQTAYRALIERMPTVQFYYFAKNPGSETEKPQNATPVASKDFYYANLGDLPAEMGHFYSDYLECWQMARSFAEAFPGVAIDVVDTPDYNRLGLFIRAALEMHGVRVGTVSLALHGTISSALLDEWGTRRSTRMLAEIRLRERLQYRGVDSRYALSAAYADELTRQSGGFVANQIDPLLIVGKFEPAVAVGDKRPDIAFIGRRERRKGPDLFIDTLWSLDRQTYGRSLIIGSESHGDSGVGSKEILESMARLRGLDVEYREHMPRTKLDEMFKGRVIVLLPSRCDQFNLVALEALRLGAPAFVSKNAGVSRWIQERVPRLADLVFDVSASRGAVAGVRRTLADYDGLRARIVDELHRARIAPDASTLETMYTPAGKRSDSADDALREIRHRLDAFNRPRPLSEFNRRSTAAPASGLPQWKQKILDSPLRPAAEAYHRARMRIAAVQVPSPVNTEHASRTLLHGLRNEISDRSPRALEQLSSAVDIEGTRSRLLRIGERTREEIGHKLKTISDEIGSKLAGRASLFRDLARLERKRGRPVVAATYAMRLMRWMGSDVYGDLDFVGRTLEAEGFGREAEATRAMFGSGDHQDNSVKALLEGQLAAQKRKELGEFAIVDDRRGDVKAKVAVIVSLYNAETKLKTFLLQLSAQSAIDNNRLEIVLVDSGSPTDEYGVFKAFMEETKLPVLYVRTAKRETIQAAWNRGIQLTKAPYLSFLGCDEGVHPDTYDLLASELDSDRDTDWMMTDSVVTNVDRRGAFVSDVMTYDRRGYDQSLVYLETCYLSWVGGLYRRSIHERFGFYDEAFRGAGDTEFKSRILPFIKSKHVAKPYGLFLNYPEERTTQHPRAEIEDQRAWYIYRTKAGVTYVWDSKPIEDVEAFFRRCLSYRKSYCGHLSTDFEMAHVVAQYMVKRAENPEFAAAALEATTAMLARIQNLESFDMRMSPDARSELVLRALVAAKRQEVQDRDRFGLADAPRYEIFNDNRYEQHWYSWSK